MNKLALAAIVFTAAACGSDDKPKGMVNTTSARAAVDQVVAINVAMQNSNGASAASAVQALTSTGQAIVTPAQPMGRMAPLVNLPGASGKRTTASLTSGTAECTPTGCTFTNYGDDTAGWSINGSIAKSGDTTTFDLQYHVVAAGTTLDWTIDGSITITPTSIDGNVHSHGESDYAGGSNAPQVSVTWDTSVDYNNVVLTDGCPTGGSIHAEVSYEVSSAQGGGSYAAQGTAEFGPTCGAVTAK